MVLKPNWNCPFVTVGARCLHRPGAGDDESRAFLVTEPRSLDTITEYFPTLSARPQRPAWRWYTHQIPSVTPPLISKRRSLEDANAHVEGHKGAGTGHLICGRHEVIIVGRGRHRRLQGIAGDGRDRHAVGQAQGSQRASSWSGR